MKKFLLISVCMILTFQLSKGQPVPLNAFYSDVNHNIMKPQLNRIDPVVSPQFMFDILGTTILDIQTNKSTLNNVFYKDNKVSAVWTTGVLFPAYPDRNVGYNYFDGLNWVSPGAQSTQNGSRWPNIGVTGNGNEVLHIKAPSVLGAIETYTRPIPGTGIWNLASTLPSIHTMNWPRMAIGGPNGNTLHCISLTDELNPVNGIAGVILYHRSDDGGQTWSVVDFMLPGVNSGIYHDMSADSYSIDADGSIVTIVQGGFTNSFALWKSTDNGNTWIKTVILPFPIPAYDQSSMITDINNDGIADTIFTDDGHLEVLIDDAGMAHCWMGGMMVYQDSGSLGIGFFPLTDGLYYWNESFGIASPVLLAVVQDLDGDGIIDVQFVTPDYESGLTSMPTACIDSAGIIYLAYSAILEGTSSGGVNNESYRDIFMMYSEDYGLNWTYPTLIYGTGFDECVFPSLARDADSTFHLVFHKDGMPGFSPSNPIGVTEVMYLQSSKAELIQFVGNPFTPKELVSGVVFHDINGNGVQDVGEYTLANQEIRINPVNIKTYTNNNGTFSIMLPQGGVFQIECNSPQNWLQTSTPLIYNIIIASQPVTNIDFGVNFINNFDSVSAFITSDLPRCNTNVIFNLYTQNNSTGQRDISLFFEHDSQNSVGYTSITPTLVSGNLYRWDLIGLNPYEFVNIEIGQLLPQAGSIISDSVYAELYFASTLLASQSDILPQTVLCSYDPNEKAVRPAGIGPQHLTPFNTPFNYTVYFQNTGNDTAFKVVIKDLIDTRLDLATLQLTGASHDYSWQLYGRELVVTFDNILLPDSNVNEPESHGYVTFRINHLPGQPEMAPIQNTAHIFFDYNSAIITNTTLNVLSSTVGIDEQHFNALKFTVHPNPLSEFFWCYFNQQPNVNYTLQIMDIAGRKVAEYNGVYNGFSADVSITGSGMYFAVLQSNGVNREQSVKKIVIR